MDSKLELQMTAAVQTIPIAAQSTPPASGNEATATANATPDASPASARYPTPQPPKFLLGQAQPEEMFGRRQAFLEALANDSSFRTDVARLTTYNGIPWTDTDTVLIVAGLRYISQGETHGLTGDLKRQIEGVQTEATSRLSEFLQAHKELNDSGGLSPPPPVMSNIRNNAIYMYNKYLGTDDVFIPNLPPMVPVDTVEI
jgi:hypothetical protein